MILIDTSAWIDFFRDREPFASAVDRALEDNLAAWCGPVETELRRGFATVRERRRVMPLLEGCHYLEQPSALWAEAGELGFLLRRRGETAKTIGLLIATYALSHAASLLAVDTDFRAFVRARVPLVLVEP